MPDEVVTAAGGDRADAEPLLRPTLTDRGVVLRGPRSSDASDWLACEPDLELYRMYGVAAQDVTPHKTEMAARDWFLRLAREPLAWVIEANGHCVGAAHLRGLDPANRRTRYSIGIFNRTYWCRGVGTKATRLVLRVAFECLRLHRVDLRVLAYNERGIRCYEKCGFVREGIEREGTLVGSEWASDVLMAILGPEYRQAARSWPSVPGTDLDRWHFGDGAWQTE